MFLELFLVIFLNFLRYGEKSKNRVACRREHQNEGLGGSEIHSSSTKNHVENWLQN